MWWDTHIALTATMFITSKMDARMGTGFFSSPKINTVTHFKISKQNHRHQPMKYLRANVHKANDMWLFSLYSDI